MPISKKKKSLGKKPVRHFAPEQYLFREGEQDETIYIIMEGRIQLFQKLGESDCLVGTLGPGDVVGEKAIVEKKPYHHSFSAQAMTETTAVHFKAKNLNRIEAKVPHFTLKLLSTVCYRLDKANELTRILQNGDQLERLVQYLHHFVHYNMKGFPDMSEIPITVEQIHHTIRLHRELIAKCLFFFTDKQVLVKQEDRYFLVDRENMDRHLPELRDYIAKYGDKDLPQVA